MSSSSGPMPATIDRILVYQFDPVRPSLGGVDTCIRGIAKYHPADSTIAFVGVDATADRRHELGRWQKVALASTTREIWFLPVARLDPDSRRRFLPHGLRLIIGLWRFRKQIPRARAIQAHKLESATFLKWFAPSTPLVYFIHSQDGALASRGSDSRWRIAGGLQSRLERRLVPRAASVVVFNDEYARDLARCNSHVHAWPTWYDSELLVDAPARNPNEVVWIGRLEPPKDAPLAVSVFESLCRLQPTVGWTLTIVGDGSTHASVVDRARRLDEDVRSRVSLLGTLSPAASVRRMLGAGTLLMTSVPHYEGYPRVLVEGLAAGLPAVVTQGTDTGHLLVEGTNGFVRGREPDELARAIVAASTLDRDAVRASIAALEGKQSVRHLLAVTDADVTDRA